MTIEANFLWTEQLQLEESAVPISASGRLGGAWKLQKETPLDGYLLEGRQVNWFTQRSEKIEFSRSIRGTMFLLTQEWSGIDSFNVMDRSGSSHPSTEWVVQQTDSNVCEVGDWGGEAWLHQSNFWITLLGFNYIH